MSNSNHKQSFQPRLSSTSYVYPLRSLLEGRIQPDADSSTPAPPTTSRSSDDVASFMNEIKDSQTEFESTLAPMGRFPDSTQSPHSPEPSGSRQRAVYSVRRATSIPDIGRSALARENKKEEAEPNTLRHDSTRKKSIRLEQFSSDHNPYFPRTFSSFSPVEMPVGVPDLSLLESVQSSMSADQVLGSQIHDIFQRGPYSLHASPLPDTPAAYTLASASATISQIPDALPNMISIGQAGQDLASQSVPRQDTDIGNLFMTDMPTPSGFLNYFDPVATPLATYPTGRDSTHNQGVHRDEHGLRLPFNPSEYGIVHLPPLPSSGNTSERGSSSASSRPRSKGSSNVFKSSGTGASFSSGPGSRAGTHTSVSGTGASAGTPSSGQSQREPSEHFSSDSAESNIKSDEPYVTMRYRSIEDENGNHVIIGRAGKLQACEDEPIRTPGAVQGFGVLIAVDEVNDALYVRQVSENATELLGLPPQFLFSLECFTDTLPDSQAGVLWDNIEFLDDPDPNSEEEEYSPHVFLLSGYGAPGSALPDEENSVDGKRIWTCWCAAHRSQVQKDGITTRGPIIMEFELERDTMNPLYPPVPYQSPPLTTMSSSRDNASAVSSGDTLAEKRRHSHSPYDTSSSGSGHSTIGNSSLPSSSGTPSFTETSPSSPTSQYNLEGEGEWVPQTEDIIESTTSHSRPLPALERLRKMTRAYGNLPRESSVKSRRSRGRAARGSSTVGMMDIFAVMTQIHEQLDAAPDLSTYLKIMVGVIKDLTQFHRVLVYQFDEMWNGEVLAELVDWSQSKDLYRGLHFPAGDIPAQARQLYEINKVRLLYDAAQPTARIVVRSKEDLETPLNMTHCYLRAMSPIHIQYLGNMGVRASMSISIMGFGRLWGLVNCHTYGTHGMRVSFPVRQMLRLLSQTISKTIERLSYAKRLHTRKLINTLVPSHRPQTGYIVSNADDLLGLFDADFGILVIGEGAKILGPNQHGQEILIMSEYLRLKQFNTIQASQAVVHDFPDLELTAGLEIIAGLLYVPLSSGGQDFITFLRKGQPRQVRWAGRPTKDAQANKLEPRASFKMWSEIVAGRSRPWTDEQLETAGVLALVYGKFIEVWRQKENAMQTTKLTNLLLSNASHEVRTPLNHIINYLEMAMNGPLDTETRENLKKSHTASKSLLFTINDLLDLTRLETGNEITFNEPFDLHFAIEEATHLYRNEAARRNIEFHVDLEESPRRVIGDTKKIRTVVQNLTANALKYTTSGSITVCCTTFGEPEGLRSINQTAVEILVSDTGCGMTTEKLASIFREFEQVESSEPKTSIEPGVGLGLAVVARIVEQLGGQLRVDSKEGKGSRFSFLIPLALATDENVSRQGTSSHSSGSTKSVLDFYASSRSSSRSGEDSIDSLIQAMSNHMRSSRESIAGGNADDAGSGQGLTPSGAIFSGGQDIHLQLQVPVVVHSPDISSLSPSRKTSQSSSSRATRLPPRTSQKIQQDASEAKLRVLIVEDNDINRTILAKRLTMDGHSVANTTNGQEGLDKVIADRCFDVVLMDLQMPILNGFEATRKIRDFEKAPNTERIQRPSHILNGRLPVFAVSASLLEHQRDELTEHGMDGWILKPIDFKRLKYILRGVVDSAQRRSDVYRPGCNWERGGWLNDIAVNAAC